MSKLSGLDFVVEVVEQQRRLYVVGNKVYLEKSEGQGISGSYFIGWRAHRNDEWAQEARPGEVLTTTSSVLEVSTTDGQTFWVSDKGGWQTKDRFRTLEERVYPQVATVLIEDDYYHISYSDLNDWLYEEVDEVESDVDSGDDQVTQDQTAQVAIEQDIGEGDPPRLRLDDQSQSITDGIIYIPRRKPTKSRLRKMGDSFSDLVNISQKEWSRLVQRLEGLVWDEVEGSLLDLISPQVTAESKPDPPLSSRQVMEQVLAGEEAIFSERRELVIGDLRAINVELEGTKFTVVDSIHAEDDRDYKPTGHYVFTDEQKAVSYMKGELGSYWDVARHTIAGQRYNHRGDWEERVRRDMLECARTGQVKR